MLLSLRRNSLTSLFKEVRVFKEIEVCEIPFCQDIGPKDSAGRGHRILFGCHYQFHLASLSLSDRASLRYLHVRLPSYSKFSFLIKNNSRRNGNLGKLNSNDFQDGNWDSMEMKDRANGRGGFRSQTAADCPRRPPENRMKSRLWVLWQHLTKC